MTVFFDDYYNTGIGSTPLPYGGEEIGYIDAFVRSLETQMMGSNTDSMTELMTEELRPLIIQMNENLDAGIVDGPERSWYEPDIGFENPGHYFSIFDETYEKARISKLEEVFNHLRKYPDLYPEYADYNEEKLTENIKNRALELMKLNEETSQRASTAGDIGSFFGSLAGVATDKGLFEIIQPLTYAEIFYGSGKQKLGQLVLKEGILGAGAEAILQTDIKDWYNSLGLQYTYEDFFKAVAAGGILGAAFPVGVRGVTSGIRLTRDQIRKGFEAFKGRGIDPKEADVQINALDNLDDLESPDGPGGPVITIESARDETGPRIIDLDSTEWQVLSDDDLLNSSQVQSAQEKMNAVPLTIDTPGYGTDKYRAERTFIDPNTSESFTGTSTAIQMLYDRAKTLAWVSDKKDVPLNPNKFDKRAIIILGPPASGKSSIANPIARKYGAAIIDSDEAKKMMPEYGDGSGANAVHEESKFMSDLAQAKAMEQGMNIVVPIVGHKASRVENVINDFRENGYEIDLVGMNVSYINARNRAVSRFIQTKRYVPIEYLQSVGEKPRLVFNELKEKGIADGYTQIDNNGSIKDPKPVIEDTRGILEDVDLRLRGDQRKSGEVFSDSQRAVGEEKIPSNIERLEERIAKTAKAQINLEKGNLPDDDVSTTSRRPAPKETEVVESDVDNFVNQVAKDTDFDNLADDEIIDVDLIIDDQVVSRTLTGAELKKELAQEQQMIDRLRGCVV
jgi:predicted kinase